MKNVLKYFSLFVFVLLVLSCSSKKGIIRKGDKRYFDANDVEISKSSFENYRKKGGFLSVQGDSVNHQKLVFRQEKGVIENKDEIIQLLRANVNQNFDRNKPIVIIFYPGKDPCNSSGASEKKWIRDWYIKLEEGVKQIANTKPIYIYKNSEGLAKYKGIISWNKDPESIIEKTFFKHHYPCSSFVVISEKGEYISYFGEFPKELVWRTLEELKKQ
ncbi:MAG: hypothetical protein RBR78_09965 [Flavobacteriaceae bacterium]|jgi:hypothetical protein|nr:hypothetical protein [Flavobacteriaceae bacterium]